MGERRTGSDNMNLTEQAQYLYGMRYRGFSPMCQPMKGLLWVGEETDKYYNILAYNRPLTDEEVKRYELEFVGVE